MTTEPLEYIIEDLANQLGIYGSCGEFANYHYHKKDCRVCWTSDLRTRLISATEYETKLIAVENLLRNSS